jgi:hypothetical protein
MRKIHPSPNFTLLANSLGFSECEIYELKLDTVIIFTYWRNAPVALKMRQGILGSISVAFFRGTNPATYGLPLTLGSEMKDSKPYDNTQNATSSSPPSDLTTKALSSSFFDNVLNNNKISSSFFDSFSNVVDLHSTNDNEEPRKDSPAEADIDSWDEVVDTNHAFYDVLLVVAKAVLEFYSDSREVIYQGIRHDIKFDLD